MIYSACLGAAVGLYLGGSLASLREELSQNLSQALNGALVEYPEEPSKPELRELLQKKDFQLITAAGALTGAGAGVLLYKIYELCGSILN